MKKYLLIALTLSLSTLIIANIQCGGSSSSNSGSSAPASGDLDASFGANGVVTTTIALATSADKIKALAIQTDGKIVAAGTASDGAGTAFALVRYNTNGSLDTTFDTDGLVTTTIGSSNNINALAIQTDGKIVAAGSANATGITHFTLARYTITGTLDTSFGGGDGVVTASTGTYDDFAYALALQDDGKILVGSNSNGYFALLRYNTNGTLDTTFDTDGVVTSLVGDGMDNSGIAITLQPDGKILMAGHAYNGSDGDFALARYTITGTLDTTFGNGDGTVTTTISSVYDYAYNLALQADGKIVVAGMTNVGSGLEDFALARYNSDGALDTTFGGGDGIVTSHIGAKDEILGILIQPDGKIVAGGHVNYGGSAYDFALARYWR